MVDLVNTLKGQFLRTMMNGRNMIPRFSRERAGKERKKEGREFSLRSIGAAAATYSKWGERGAELAVI